MSATGPLSNSDGLTPSEFLELADNEMKAGNSRRAAELLWKATRGTLLNLAQKRGLVCGDEGDDSLIALASAMEKNGSASEYYYRGKVAAGSLLRDHADFDALEDYELESAYKSARQFVVDWNSELN